MAPDAAAAAGGKKRKRYLPHNVSALLPLFLLSIFQFQFVLFSYAIFRYFLQKPVKKGSYPLHPGVQGFFITCDGGREHQASREALNILDSVLYLRSFFSFSTIN
jgi:tRNA acetyltransferase TAN1